MLSLFRKTAFALPLLLLGAQPASAIPFSGTFAHDDDYQFFTFTIGAPTTVHLDTISYASGGFVPYLHVWTSAGLDLSGVTPVNSDASYAVDLTGSGTAGTYYVGLTVANNMANGNDLPGGIPTPTIFDHNGQGDFTNSQWSCGGTGAFFTSACDQRTGAWALDITGADSASLWPVSGGGSVPEPTSLALAFAGAAAFAPYGRRRRSSASA